MGYSVLETMRLEDGLIVRRARHVARAAAAAGVLGFRWNAAAVDAALDACLVSHADGVWRTRLLVAPGGEATVECAPLVHDESRVWRVGLAPEPVASGNPLLRLKTTQRDVYERAKAARPDLDDVLLWNERGEITESTIANVVVELDGTWWTPPVSCGLLPGVFRAAVLEARMVQEGVVTQAQLARATRLWLINSLREWIRAELEPAHLAGRQGHAP